MTTAADERPRSTRLPRSERRARLLESALDVFVASGYHAAAMDHIAEHAGVSKPVLYQHFPNKLELYLALLDVACDQVTETVRGALTSQSHASNRARLAATTAAFYAYTTEAGSAFRLVFESDLLHEPAVRERVDRATMSCANAIAEAIAEDADQAAEASLLIAVAVVGMSQVSARFCLSANGKVPQTQAAELIARLAWCGVHGFSRHT